MTDRKVLNHALERPIAQLPIVRYHTLFATPMTALIVVVITYTRVNYTLELIIHTS